MKQRNCTIDCLKFFCAWFVALYHFYGAKNHFIGGYIAVEFFLLAASVFFYAKYDREKRMNGGEYERSFIIKRFWRFFPWAFSAFLFTAVVVRGITVKVTSLGELLDFAVYDLGEILLLKMNGVAMINASLLNGAGWTLSSMLLVEFVLWYCLHRLNRPFTEIIAPLSIIIGLGIWAHAEDTQVKNWMSFTTFGTLRTWIAYCEGYYCYRLSQRLGEIRFNRNGRIVLTGIECVCYIFAAWAMMKRANKYYQWCVTLLFAIAIAISISGHSVINRFLSGHRWRIRTSVFLGEISFSIYLMHETVLKLFIYYVQEPAIRYGYVLHFVLISICCAILQWCFVPRCIQMARRIREKGKCLLINT